MAACVKWPHAFLGFRPRGIKLETTARSSERPAGGGRSRAWPTDRIGDDPLVPGGEAAPGGHTGVSIVVLHGQPRKVRIVPDRPLVGDGRNSVPVYLDVDYGAMGGFLSFLRRGAVMAGLELLGCFPRRSGAPASRRCLGVRHPVSGHFRMFLLLPFSLGPPHRWNGRFVKEVLQLALAARPSLRVADFVGDLRMVAACGPKNQLLRGMVRMVEMFPELGPRPRAKEP